MTCSWTPIWTRPVSTHRGVQQREHACNVHNAQLTATSAQKHKVKCDVCDTSLAPLQATAYPRPWSQNNQNTAQHSKAQRPAWLQEAAAPDSPGHCPSHRHHHTLHTGGRHYVTAFVGCGMLRALQQSSTVFLTTYVCATCISAWTQPCPASLHPLNSTLPTTPSPPLSTQH
jgi:hypothetical protein